MSATDHEIRRRRVLLAVIESFIDTALPVGSRTVSEKARLGLSAATIRNVMAELEQDGFLTHPHTSAGRVPTAKGYRFYVDHLVTSEHLNEMHQQMIEEVFQHSELIEKVMEKTVRILCNITNQVAFVLCPKTESSTLKRIELIPLKAREVLVVLVADTGVIRNAMVQLQDPMEAGELLRISNFLNTELVDLSLSEVYDRLYSRLLDERSSFFYICKQAKEILENSGVMNEEGEIYLEGARTILDKPEFRDYAKMQPLLLLLEEKKNLLEILRRDTTEGIRIYIDDEMGYDNIKGCSLITSGYRIGEKSYGALGVIGPTRLPYARVMSILDYISSKMTEWTETF